MFDILKVNELGKDGLKLAYTSLQGFALFLTVALALILLIAYLIVRKKSNENLQSFKKIALGTVIGYTITLTCCISFFMIARLKIKEELNVNYYLILIFLALCLIYAISKIFTVLLSKKANKICDYIGIALLFVYALLLLLLLKVEDSAYEPLSKVGMYIFTIVLLLAIAIPTLFLGNGDKNINQTQSVAYAGITIALAFTLSYIKLFSLPQGGSITLASMLPLIIYAYVFGAKKGVFVGVIYGILQCLQSPQIYQPLQVLIDYPIAFGAIGVAGIVKNIKFLKTPVIKFVFGACVGCILRYFSHVISGYYVFSSWAMEGYTALSWAFVYNLYVLAELAIILVVGLIIFSSKSVNKMIEGINK